MTNKRFVSLLVTMFLCFVVLFGSAGCGGDNNSSNFAENEPTNPAPNPVPTPIVSPDPVPKPTPSNPDPVPKPDSVPESPDVPEPTPASPDQPVPDPMPVVSPDQVTPTPLPEPEPEPEPEPAPAPYYPEPEPIPSGYTVFFDSKGGSIVPSVHVSSGSTVDMPENPTRDGYIFAGWYKDEDFTEIFTFGTDGDKITQNTRLYAQWFKLDTLMAEYAIGEIVIGYAGGDNPKYVTRNLTLPSKAGEVNIAWSSSNPDIISSAGTVTRPSDSDINVTLTATATSGTESKTKEFSLNVIRARYRVSHDVEVVPVQDVGIGDLSITYKLSSDQIVDIEGNYSKITIQNADDALDAIQGIHEALGINNPYEELQTFLATSDSYGSEYTFQQVYKGVKVFGRSVMASTNASGEGNFLHSSFLASSVLDSADMRINLSASEAEDSAKDNYSGNVSADTARTELIVYSLEDCENAPVYAYIVRVYGVLGNDYVDNTVLVNANSGESITQYPNICNAVDIRKASGDNEFGHNVSFDVVYELVGSVATYNLHMSYVMRDPNHHICMYDGFRIPVLGQNWLIISGPTIKSLTNTWTDRQQVTVYANMREIMKWWEESFERNSLDGNGSTVNVVTHTLFAEDNAYWSHQALSMLVHDKPEVSSYDHFMGAAVDVLTHETTHGVLQHIANELIYKDASGAINEGYADVFACIKDANWQFGEDLFDAGNKFRCMRDIAELSNDVTLNKYKLFSLDQVYYRYKTNKAEKGNDYNFVHLFGMIVSHAAYLMHQDTTPTNGLTWEELGKVWYKSMHMGLSATSIFEDVRRCVLWAAQEINLPQNKIAAIKSAFDEVGITDSTQKATLKGTVTDYNTDNNLSDVDVVAFDGRISGDAVIGKLFGRKSTPTTGRYSFEFEAGTYPIMMRKEGYVVFQGLATITKSQDIRLDVSLVRPGNGSLSGTITRSEDKSLLYDVTVNIRSGWNVQNTKVIQTTSTDTEGKYSFSSLDNGYYTVEL